MSMSIEALSRRLRPAVTAFFQRRLPDVSEAEDLTQEVMTALVRRGDISNIANVDGYVFQIAANLLKDRARSRRRRPLLYGPPFDLAVAHAADELSPERIAAGRDMCRELEITLQEMPERMRTIFILNRFEDLTGREIAARLNLSISTIEKNMMRATALLRDRLL